MRTGSQRYRTHKVWDTLGIKLEALKAARYDDATMEQWRKDLIEWLTEASKTKVARQPALYLGVLDEMSQALNELQTGNAEFKRYVGVQRQPHNPQMIWRLEPALRALPLPPPKDLKDSYVELLDKEIEVRTARLDELEERVSQTEAALTSRLEALENVNEQLDVLRTNITTEREHVASIVSSAERKINAEWDDALATWKKERAEVDADHDSRALEHVASLAATTEAGKALAAHAAGDLSAADWKGRAKRERSAAQWMRAGAAAALVFAGAMGAYIVVEAIRNDFDLTLGDGILRSSVAFIIGAFGGLLLRESGRHFREADTAEDVSLSLQALAPFYAGSADEVQLEARRQVGDAVLVRNVLSRFAHRDAAKHAAEIPAEMSTFVRDATEALKGSANQS